MPSFTRSADIALPSSVEILGVACPVLFSVECARGFATFVADTNALGGIHSPFMAGTWHPAGYVSNFGSGNVRPTMEAAKGKAREMAELYR